MPFLEAFRQLQLVLGALMLKMMIFGVAARFWANIKPMTILRHQRRSAGAWGRLTGLDQPGGIGGFGDAGRWIAGAAWAAGQIPPPGDTW